MVRYYSGVEGPSFRRAAIFSHFQQSSSDNLRLGIRLALGLGSVVWLWQYQELFPATTMSDGFQNGGPFGIADLNQKSVLPDTGLAQRIQQLVTYIPMGTATHAARKKCPVEQIKAIHCPATWKTSKDREFGWSFPSIMGFGWALWANPAN